MESNPTESKTASVDAGNVANSRLAQNLPGALKTSEARLEWSARFRALLATQDTEADILASLVLFSPSVVAAIEQTALGAERLANYRHARAQTQLFLAEVVFP